MKLVALLLLVPFSLAFADSHEDSRVDLVNCSVTTSFEHTAFDGRCRNEEVMTGLQAGNPPLVRCSRLEVRCPNSAVPDPATAENPSHN